jgi:hypothetical protein
MAMLNPATLVASAVGRDLAEGYRRAFGEQQPRYALVLDEGARLILERIAGSDALYHDMNHTVMVTLVGQDILRGLRLTRMVSPEDWLHYLLAALTHDIGYIRGICPGDTAEASSSTPTATGSRRHAALPMPFSPHITSNAAGSWCAIGSARCPRSMRSGLRGPSK